LLFERTTPLFGAPIGVILFEFCQDFWQRKNKSPWLSYGIVCVILGLAIIVGLRLVTDRRTDMMMASTVPV